jgi:protein-S-isoprenylcysteine O-methyltransferase Ste14
MERKDGLMKRIVVFAYGVAAYLGFLGVFLYAIGFIGNFGVPKSLDSRADVSWETALMTDVALLSLFALQHSIMARKGLKRFITRWIPHSAERSTYVVASSCALALLFWKWQPLGGVVWTVDNTTARALLYVAYAFGWTLVLVATFAINHFDLFGLRQVWTQLHGRSQAALRFSMPALYRIVRHPLYVGWLFVFWSTPDMTVSHVFFAAMTTAYILVAIRFEEADLMREHPEYAVYRTRVPMLLPRLSGAATRHPAVMESSAAAQAVSAKTR